MTESDLSPPTTFSVLGMNCQHCVDAVTAEVSKVDGVAGVVVDLDAQTVAVSGGERAAVLAAIDEAGFDVA